MKPKFITLTLNDYRPISYTVNVDQIASFTWESWNNSSAVTMANGVVIDVVETPAQIAKKIQAACQPRCKTSVEDASAHPSEGVKE